MTAVLKVALPLPLPRLFDYLPADGVAADLADIGRRVRVAFGNRQLCGVVAAVAPAEPRHADALKAVEWLEPEALLVGELLASLRWLARYLHAPLGEVLATALPAALRRGEPVPDTHTWGWCLTEAGATAWPAMRTGRPRSLTQLLADGTRDEDALDALQPGWRTPMRGLRERGLVERVAIAFSSHLVGADAPQGQERRNDVPAPGATRHPLPRRGEGKKHFELNPEQQAAADAIRATEGFTAFLLDGITGSGKTEVYLDAISTCLARGKQALVLVPEIGLTPQLLARFRARLGVPVHALHSGLNDGERAQAWTAAWRGEARVVVGTRSAVFTPLPDAGLVVVDEEHDASYKQQDGIRYHARDFALVRARELGVPIVLGSATPSLESLHNARSGRFQQLRLRKRAGEAQPPTVRVLDVRKRPLQAGLSPELLSAVRAALDAGGQVLLFRNRRGYAPALLCHDCGWSACCAHCGMAEQGRPMTVHAHGRRLQCHHCGFRQAAPLACPACASLALQPQGSGTERIEELLAETFADVPVLRIDRGNTRRRDALQKHFDELGSRPGILVGTQMLAKGHDLPNLTLVGVVGIDEGLFSADFRASEKLAQLLVQVAGRAGRAERAGTVLLQTHHPEHPLLQTLVHGGYHAFAEAELALREAAGFPPFAHLALLRAESPHVEPPMQFLAAAKKSIDSLPPASGGKVPKAEGGLSFVELHGPLPAPMPRRAGWQRAQLLLSSPDRRALHATLDAVVPRLYELPEARKLRWSLDVDPVDLY
jgi:primosomal protein N' (replication factor Y)